MSLETAKLVDGKKDGLSYRIAYLLYREMHHHNYHILLRTPYYF